MEILNLNVKKLTFKLSFTSIQQRKQKHINHRFWTTLKRSDNDMVFEIVFVPSMLIVVQCDNQCHDCWPPTSLLDFYVI